MNDHVNLLKAYLEELCGHIERRERTLSWPNWRKRALAAATPIAVGLAVSSCGGEVEQNAVATECSGTTCATLCADGKDNDADGLIDCADNDCAAASNCGASPIYSAPLPESNCADGVDNDSDGAVDCADSDCSLNSACATRATETSCTDGIDNDGDGYVDCADGDCAASTVCSVAEYGVMMLVETDCADGLDDDGDWHVDCGDTDCAAATNCVGKAAETNCGDGIDNDGDGKIDCADTECLCSIAIYDVFMEPK